MAVVASLISAAARKIWPSILGAVRQGLTANRALEAFKAAGYGIRRQDFLAAYRVAKNQAATVNWLKYLKPESVPNPLRLPEAATRTARKYSFLVRVDILQPSGMRDKRYVWVATDAPRSRFALEEMAQDALSNYAGRTRETDEVIGAQLLEGIQAGPLGYRFEGV